MAAEAVADRSGSSLTNATTLQAVVLDTELHVLLDGRPWKRIMIEGNDYGSGEGRRGTNEGKKGSRRGGEGRGWRTTRVN